MKNAIKIEKIYYFGETTGSDDYNAKCLYFKAGKSYLAHLYIDYFNEVVFTSLHQPSECTVLKGLCKAVNEFEFNN